MPSGVYWLLSFACASALWSCSARSEQPDPRQPTATDSPTPAAAAATAKATADAAAPTSKGDEVSRLDQACSSGDADACADLGVRLRLGTRGAEHDLPRARQVLEAGCSDRNGQHLACYHLAEMYLAGLGGPRIPSRGIKTLRVACAAKVMDACGYLGLIFVEGLASPDIPYAKHQWRMGMKIWEEACQEGHAKSCASAADRYRGGFPIGKDAARAAQLAKRACELGAEDECGKAAP